MVESLPVGSSFAYDAEKGRLWVICIACQRWSLVPIEARWEAVEQLERLASTRARLLAQTANVALLDIRGLRIVRVGPATLRETAWWRYGRQLVSRRDRSQKIVRRGKIVDASLMFILTGLPIWGWADPKRWVDRARRKHFGRHAWRGFAQCAVCGRTRRDLRFDERASLVIERVASGSVELALPCVACAGRNADAVQRIASGSGTQVLRRVLAYQNFEGAQDSQIARAVSLIDQVESPAALVERYATRRVALGRLDAIETLSLEIAASEDEERRISEMQVRELETHWRAAEELAAIVDGELTP